SSDATAPYSATVTFTAPMAPGSYQLTAQVGDGFDPTPTSATIVIEVDSCVWVRQGGTGTGATPATPMGSVQLALDTAKNSAGASACVQANGVFGENLVLP